MYNEAMNGNQNITSPMNGAQPMMGYPMLNMQNFQRVYISGDNIVNFDNIVIGVKKEVYEEALSIAEEYKKILEEHGLIEKEKTPEELATEQAKILTDINGVLNTILTKMGELDTRMTSLETGSHTVKEVTHGNKHPETVADGVKSDRSKPNKAE